MSLKADKFLKAADKKAFDIEHRKKLNYNISRYDQSVLKGKKQYSNLDLAKDRAAHLKNKVINNLDKYLIEFESNFTKNGGKVVWAKDVAEAWKEILTILEKRHVKAVVKSKSMVTEEIKLNDLLHKNGIESLETDLGEFIQQLDNEPPYHIVTPAMHKSRQDIAKLFNEKYNTPEEYTPEELTGFVRQLIRKKFSEAGAGVTGANFIVADTGSISITENEGNALMSVGFPKIHIAIVGIEKLIPSIKHLDLFWPLLSTHGTGQMLTVYNHLISGPKRANEKDGPEEMYVILLDNGRTDLLAQHEQRRALACIRCGACLNTCPVYKNVGGHTYDTVYSGPIGSVITPYMRDFEEYKHLSYASSLCGACTEVCPVRIDIHNLLLYNRKDNVKRGLTGRNENWSMFVWKKAMLNRKIMERGGSKIKNFVLNQFFKKSWGSRRKLPVIASRSFNQQWRDRQKGRN